MSATVWRAIVKSTGEEVAVKNLDLESLTCSIDEIVREVRRFSPCFAWLWGAETPVAVADPPSPEFLPCSSPFFSRRTPCGHCSIRIYYRCTVLLCMRTICGW
jgi:hypothetical protein